MSSPPKVSDPAYCHAAYATISRATSPAPLDTDRQRGCSRAASITTHMASAIMSAQRHGSQPNPLLTSQFMTGSPLPGRSVRRTRQQADRQEDGGDTHGSQHPPMIPQVSPARRPRGPHRARGEFVS